MVKEAEEFEKWWAGHNTLVSGTKQQNRFVWFCATEAMAKDAPEPDPVDPVSPADKFELVGFRCTEQNDELDSWDWMDIRYFKQNRDKGMIIEMLYTPRPPKKRKP